MKVQVIILINNESLLADIPISKVKVAWVLILRLDEMSVFYYGVWMFERK